MSYSKSVDSSTTTSISNKNGTNIVNVSRISGSYALDVNLAGQDNPVDLTGTVDAEFVGPMEVTGAVEAQFNFPLEVFGDVNISSSIPLTASISGVVPVELTGALQVIDVGNCSTTPLSASTAFTGTWVDTLGFASVAYSIQSDKQSATGGIQQQWSQDGTNMMSWGHDTLGSDRTGVGNGTDMVVRCHSRYFRLVYLNGNQDQSFFRLQTILNRFASMADTIGVAHAPADGDDALLTKSVITGLSSQGGGTFVDVKVNPAGKLLVVANADALTTSAVTSVSASGGLQTLLASNAGRYHASVYNNGTTDLYLKLGASGSTSSFTTKLVPGAFYELQHNGGVYTGVLTGIWSDSPTGAALVTEETV